MKKKLYIRNKYLLFTRSIFNLPILTNIGRSKIALVLGLILILLWQFSVIMARNSLQTSYANKAASAISYESKFVYFYYYLGLFSVATEIENPEYSRKGAEDIVSTKGSTLLTEYKSTIRWGDWGQMFLYLPYTYFKGSPAYLDPRPTAAAFFILSLLLTFAAFWHCRLTVPGALLVLFMGSNPFQLYEVYKNPNVFGMSISLFLILIAINLPYILNKKTSLSSAITRACLTGIIIATIQQTRTGTQIMLISASFIYIVTKNLSLPKRATLLIGLFLCYLGALGLFNRYFLYKFDQADKFVSAHGGHVYNGPKDFIHRTWHSVFMGLSDFDKDFSWDDRFAILYTLPLLEKKNGIKYPEFSSKLWGFKDFYYDKGKKFIVEGQQLPDYEVTIRNETISLIRENPLWYLTILSERAQRFFKDTTPVRTAIGSVGINLPFSGFLVIPLIILLAAVGNRKWIILIFASFPLAGVMMLVYSGGGTPFYNCYHLICAALFFSFILEAFLRALRYRKRQSVLGKHVRRVGVRQVGD